jgi:CDP-diacylglycerol--serine O-phosphatidyltransferase
MIYMKMEETIVADFITLANGFCGLLAIMYVFDGEFAMAMMLILLGIIIDGIDGLMARMFKIQNTHGVYLDSIADTVTFCFAPSILIYGMYYDIGKGTSFQSPENALVVTASMLVVLFGILRLARFIEKGHKLKNYSGLPTPAAALVIVMAVAVLDNQFIVLVFAILISILMISKIQYPKLSKIEGGAGGLVIMIGIFAIWFDSTYSTLMSSIVFVLAIVYVVLGPLYTISKKGDRNGRGR